MNDARLESIVVLIINQSTGVLVVVCLFFSVERKEKKTKSDPEICAKLIDIIVSAWGGKAIIL
jgi:uncharacterized protein YneF (UPF0154 family)